MRLDHLLSKSKSRGCFIVKSSGNDKRFLVAMRPGDTPVPIPNTMVKTQAADGTMLETAWESRWLPESLKKQLARVLYIDTDTSEWMENKTKSVWRMC